MLFCLNLPIYWMDDYGFAYKYVLHFSHLIHRFDRKFVCLVVRGTKHSVKTFLFYLDDGVFCLLEILKKRVWKTTNAKIDICQQNAVYFSFTLLLLSNTGSVYKILFLLKKVRSLSMTLMKINFRFSSKRIKNWIEFRARANHISPSSLYTIRSVL